MRSLITLKALTYAPTGGIVAAPTTSLPEWIGSVRNWDYRFCWLRDATLHAARRSPIGGYAEEALAWRDWLLRAAAGDPEDLQIMYGPAGERRLTEYTVDWLDGLRGLRRRCGSATRRASSSSSTSTARCSRRCTSTRKLIPDDDGHRDSWALETRDARVRSRRSGAAPTRASGRCAARASTSPTRR